MFSNPAKLLAVKRRLPSYWPLIALGIVHLLCQSYILTLDLESITSSITIDDTYYYLQPAWNLKQFGFITFDGIHATNGFQFAWFLIVASLAFLAPSKAALLYATLAVCFLFNLLSLIPIWAIGAATKRPSLALFAAALWAFVTLGTATYVTGMENSLHAFIFWLVIWQMILFLKRVRRGQSPSLLPLTLLLVLNAWARLDAGLFSALFFLLAVVSLYRTGATSPAWRRHIIKAVLFAVLGLVIILTFYQFTGDTYLPVSALVKQEWASWDHLLSSPVGLPGLALLLALALMGLQMNRLYLPENENMRVAIQVWFVLLAGLIVHLVLAERTRAYSAYHWYLSPAIIFLLLTTSITLDWTGDVIARRFTRQSAHIYGRLLTLLLILLTLHLYRQHTTDAYVIYRTRYRVALWMAENLPQDSVCASWNAGQFGYFSQRTVINLDGLMNNVDYYRRVVSGPLEWPQYVREEGVTCIVDYGDRIGQRSGFTLLHSFPVETQDNLFFHIWRVDY